MVFGGLLTKLVLLAVFAFASTATALIKIELCQNHTSEKHRELLLDLLELSLLLHPHIETRPCSPKVQSPGSYVFRQNVSEIIGNKAEKGRIEVIGALYDPKGRAIFSQLELIEKPSRKRMQERAQGLTTNILRAIAENQDAIDPFANQKAEVSKKSLAALAESVNPYDGGSKTKTTHEDTSASSLGLFLGIEWISQQSYSTSFFHSKELVVTKPFIIIGSSFSQSLLPHLVLNVAARGAAMPIEFIRPLELKKNVSNRVFKMFDCAAELAVLMPLTEHLSASIGLMVGSLFVDSDIKERVPLAFLSSFWQFKQGINAMASYLVKVFDSRLSLQAGYFPFVQNSAVGTKMPFQDFGWHFGISAESKVYRSFGIKFLIHQHGEVFAQPAHESPKRVVSQSALAYLGVVGSF